MKYMVFIDILGYHILPENIASEKGLDSEMIRKNFYSTIDLKIKNLKDCGIVREVSEGRDDCSLHCP